MLAADDPRPGAQAELLRVLQKQGVEISRATAPFTVTVPGKKRGPARQTTTTTDGSGGSGGPECRRVGATRRAGRRRTAAGGGRTEHAAAAGHAHLPRRLVHRPHGSAVQPHRRFVARLSVLEPERSAEDAVRRHRLDVPRAVQRAGGSRRRREGARRADRKDDRRGPRQGRRRRATRIGVPREPQRRHRARDAALHVQGRVVRGGGGAVRGRRQEIQPRLVHHQERRRRRPARRPRPISACRSSPSARRRR